MAHIPVGDAVKCRCGKKQNSELAAWISRISVNLEGKKKWIKADYLLKNFGQHILNNQTFPTIPDFRLCTGSVPVNSFSFEHGYISLNPWGFLLCPLAHLACLLIQKKSLLYNLQGGKKKNISLSAERFPGPCCDLILTQFQLRTLSSWYWNCNTFFTWFTPCAGRKQ